MPLFTIKSEKNRPLPCSSEFSSAPQQYRNYSANGFFSLLLDDSRHLSAPIKKIVFVVLIPCAMLLLSILCFQLWQQRPTIAQENDLLELGQSGFLLLACATLALRAGRIQARENLNKPVFAALGLLTLAMFLREVDIDKLGTSPVWALAEKVLRGIAAIAVLNFSFSLLPKIKLLLRNVGKILQTPIVMLAVLALVLYICSWPFDKRIILVNKPLSQFIEEIIELNACYLFALAAFARGVKQDSNG